MFIIKEKIIQFDLVVAHINHMIREEAIDDEEYVQKYVLTQVQRVLKKAFSI